MKFTHVSAHVSKGRRVRGHVRRGHIGSKRFWALPTFKAKLRVLMRESGMPKREASAVLAKELRAKGDL